MRTKLFLLFFLWSIAFIHKANAQTMIEYKGIKIYNFKTVITSTLPYPDTLNPTSEWYLTLKGSTLNELTEKELTKIAASAIENDCIVMYLCLEHKETFNKKPDQVYVLGFERKK